MTEGSPADPAALERRLAEIERDAAAALQGASSPDAKQEARYRYLGRKGELSQVLRSVAGLSEADRRRIGALGNQVKERLEALVDAGETGAAVATQALDPTLPGIPIPLGTLHPLTRMTDEVCRIFRSLGFGVADGPEIETAEYNFDRLNTKEGHPSRDPRDTFYISQLRASASDPVLLLRTHTSPVQIRTLLQGRLPVRIIVPGRVFRRDQVDATHSPVFHQVEGLYVDEGVSLAHLKGVFASFARQAFGASATVRLRPSYFPFTEPSVELDVSCVFCAQRGCSICKQEGWIELLGAGMVHPNVLAGAGVDAARYTGFAFGMGIERLTMLRYGINEIRHFYENDIRFLKSVGR